MTYAKSFFLITLFFVPFSTFAADADNRFMAKGAGLASCERFLNAVNAKSKEYYIYGGWIEGYITAYNQLRPDTFDVAPWQSADYLVSVIAAFCKKNTNASYYQATASVVKALDSKKLAKHTPLLTVSSEGNKLLVHKAVLEQAQEALNKGGYYKTKEYGVFNKATEIAIKQFQKDKALKQTGLPDQPTLINLFYGQR